MSRPKRNFAPMPLAVLASDCSPAERLFVLALMQHDWDGEKAWPSLPRLVALTGFSKRTLRTAAHDLEARGWLKVDRERGRGNIYHIDIPDMGLDEFNAWVKLRVEEQTTAPDAALSDEPEAESKATIAAPVRQPLPPNKSQGNESHKTLTADAVGLELTAPPAHLKAKKPQAKVQPFQAADGTAWQVMVDAYVTAYREAKGDPAAKAELTAPDFAQLKRLARTPGFTVLEYKRRLANMKHHDFHAQQEYSLTYFCTRYREFSDGAERIKKRHGRAGRYIPVTEVEDFDGK